MKKLSYICTALLILSCGGSASTKETASKNTLPPRVEAQTEQKQKDMSHVTITINIRVEELAFIWHRLKDVIIYGYEIGPFVDLHDYIFEMYKEASEKKKKNMDVVFSYARVNNFMFFMNRAKLKGLDVNIHQDIVKKMMSQLKKAK